MVETSQPHIQGAIEVCEREIQFATAELDAFEQFQSRLHEIDPQQSAVETTGPGSVCKISGDH
jgi:hypothetical protein